MLGQANIEYNLGVGAAATSIYEVPGSVDGYGIYQSHNSSIFKPGEKIVLYMEPVGYSYKPIGSK